MELKNYQNRALDRLARWNNQLSKARAESEKTLSRLGDLDIDTRDISNFPKKAWDTLSDSGEVSYPNLPYVDRWSASGKPIPHVCLKVPTGGGKTLLACTALERMNKDRGLVLWMVPTKAIYAQTKLSLWNREHPYRQTLERASGGRVKVLEKNDSLTSADLEHYLVVMLISLHSANRKLNKEFLKLFQDTGRYMSFFPELDYALGDAQLRNKYPDLHPDGVDEPVTQSLHNVFKMVQPFVILDEAHKAYGKKAYTEEAYAQTINELNPSLVIELTATPSSSKSNLLVDIAGQDLKDEEMIKLPINVTSFANSDWRSTLGHAHTKLEQLDTAANSLYHRNKRYIRPISLVRVERTGSSHRHGNHVHAEDVREYLTKNLGIAPDQIAIQSSEKKELNGIDLFSKTTSIRWIITQSALMEGWDCSFAYLLVLLDNTKAKLAITQLTGRVLRQPHARLTTDTALDQCYVYCQSTAVREAVQYVKNGLELLGMGDLNLHVKSSEPGLHSAIKINIKDSFRNTDIFLPKVLHRVNSKSWTELDFDRHLLPHVDFDGFDLPSIPPVGEEALEVRSAKVDVDEHGIAEEFAPARPVKLEQSIEIAWFSRRISDLVPNAFQAANLVDQMLRQLRQNGEYDEAINSKRNALAAHLREHIARFIDLQAESIFRSKISVGDIRFDLKASDNFRVRKSYEISVAKDDRQLQQYGETTRLYLYESVYEREFNDLEQRFAFYLDQQQALKWWYRVAVRSPDEFYLKGWRRDKIWPDFVAMAGPDEDNPSVLVFETKGGFLDGNDDTEYKKKVFKILEQSLNAGSLTVQDGQIGGVFRLVFDKESFPDASEAISMVTGSESN